MRFFKLAAAAAALATAEATYTGFNYGSTFTDGSAKQQSDFETEFNRAKSLQGTDGKFTSARLFTMIQGGTTDTPISAIPAAIDTHTTLLLTLWASAGQAVFSNELIALTSAIDQYGTAFTDLIAGITVGSEDLYRISPTGIENESGVGAGPSEIVNYINQVRSAISGTAASGAAVGHVDTWTAWVNSSNDAVISASDFIGMDAYPYFQTTINNAIDGANATFFEAYDNTVAAAQGKDVWITETGWPVSGPQENLAVASVANAESYWQDVACTVLGNINTWWYTLQDAEPTTPSPSFGIVPSDLNAEPLYNLVCSNGDAPSSSTSSSASSSPASSASSATSPASASGPNTESLTATTPGPESSPSSASVAPTTATATDDHTYTTLQTSLVTITSCSSGCTKTTAPSSVADTSTVTTAVTTSAPCTTSTTATTPAAPSGSSCPPNLNGQYEYPHLIVPIDSSSPDKAYGTQYNATITPTISTIFNFDLPASYSGKTCSLVFLFPEQSALETSAFTFNGQGGISVNELSSPATEQTTYNTKPAVAVGGIGSVASVQPGNEYVIASHTCNAGARQAFEFVSTGGLDLEYFQDWNPSPIGAYITVC